MCKDKMEKLIRELEEIEMEDKVSRKQSYIKNRSMLDKYRGEILYIHQVRNKKPRIILRWLRRKKSLIPHRTTLYRRIKQWINGER